MIGTKWTAEQIRAARKSLDLTIEELARRLDISFNTVSRWERGKCSPDKRLNLALTRLFGDPSQLENPARERRS